MDLWIINYPEVHARAVGVTMLTEVGDAWAVRRHEPADSNMVARDRVAPETP